MNTSTSPDNTLAAYRQWLLKMATVFAPHRRDIWQDLAQEGHIAMWKALKTFDPTQGALPHWLTSNARRRMVEVLRRNDLWTGTDNPRGKERFPTAAPLPPDDDYLTGLTSGETVDRVELSYHDGDIARALGTLTEQQRDYVMRRFWGDATYEELHARYGVNPSSIWQRAKPKLARSLAHLVGAV